MAKVKSLVDNMLLLNQAALGLMQVNDEISIVKRLLHRGIEALGADFGYCQMVTPQGNFECVYKTSSMPYTPRQPRKTGLTASTFRARQPTFINNVLRSAKVSNDAKPFMASLVVIPITYKQDNFGTLIIALKKHHRFTDQEKIL